MRSAHLLCLAVFALTFGCSRKEAPPIVKPAPAAKALINVVHDAVKSRATGAPFQAPPGITIEASKASRDEGGKQVEYLEVAGMQEKAPSLAVIIFRVPATWLTTEKEKLGALDGEVSALNACAQKIREDESQGKKPDPTSSCRLLEITANNRPGITIQDERARHLEMLVYQR